MAMFGGHMRPQRGLTPVFRARPLVAGHTLSALKCLDGARRDAHPKGRAREAVGDGVVMVIDADVIVRADSNLLPIGMNMACRGKRDQGGLVQPLEELLA